MHFWAINGPEYLQKVIRILPVLPTLEPKLLTKEKLAILIHTYKIEVDAFHEIFASWME